MDSGTIPRGLLALYKACNQLYPDQLNPLQVSAVVKFWLGGPDPLDYISMYAHPGNDKDGTPPHWHYVSFGLSDLHGDGRVYARPSEAAAAVGGSVGGDEEGSLVPSGLGVELTFRLSRNNEVSGQQQAPPTWPAKLLQSLAKYIVQTGNLLVVGDHISHHRPLNADDEGTCRHESRLCHVLVAEDVALGRRATCHGYVQFVQIVGITGDELEAVQQWNGQGVIDIMRRTPGAGGALLVSDMSRARSVMQLERSVRDEIECGIDVHGSSLSGVSAWRLTWRGSHGSGAHGGENDAPNKTSAEIESGGGAGCMSSEWRVGGRCPDLATDQAGSVLQHSQQHQQSLCHQHVHISMNVEAALTLPLALRGRLKHGRHFTYKCVSGRCAVTLLGPLVQGSLCSAHQPFMSQAGWLQVCVSSQLVERMLCDLHMLTEPSGVQQLELPHTFSWSSHGLSVTLTPDPAPT